MGWHGHDARDRKSFIEAQLRDFESNGNQIKFTILKRSPEVYAVRQAFDKDGNLVGQIIIVCLVRKDRNGPYMMKSMGENEHPFYYNVAYSTVSKYPYIDENGEQPDNEWRKKLKEVSVKKSGSNKKIEIGVRVTLKSEYHQHVSDGDGIFEVYRRIGQRGWGIKNVNTGNDGHYKFARKHFDRIGV